MRSGFRAMASLLAVVMLAACGAPSRPEPGSSPAGPPTAGSPSPPPLASPSPSPSALPAPSPTAAGFPSGCLPIAGGAAPARATILDLRAAPHPGYDRLVVEFSGTQVPAFRLEEHEIGGFVTSFRGSPVTILGQNGILLHLYNQDIPPVFAHGTDLRPAGPALKEVAVLGDFEGQADIAIGVEGFPCPAVSLYESPPRLVIDFPTGS